MAQLEDEFLHECFRTNFSGSITPCMAIHRCLGSIMEFNILQTCLQELAKLTAHIVRVRYRHCTDEAELADHFIG
ncbi:hypothetical protein SADUNF_Sadunf05G0060700 [Salix dunnii]|uniref:Uncharacterized protein n=1 Tax=Salix dunnii TaxID=1413687 RepID=A0A835K2Q8_9ROSI|nr:hypothetical protein SADUNF_Sadunf05G0060700 [Salix dunnii]